MASEKLRNPQNISDQNYKIVNVQKKSDKYHMDF